MNLINYDKTWRIVVCINPNHDTVRFNTNKIGNIFCPTCGHLMIVEIKSSLVYDMDEMNEELDNDIS